MIGLFIGVNHYKHNFLIVCIIYVPYILKVLCSSSVEIWLLIVFCHTTFIIIRYYIVYIYIFFTRVWHISIFAETNSSNMHMWEVVCLSDVETVEEQSKGNLINFSLSIIMVSRKIPKLHNYLLINNKSCYY